tara:strand:- start:1440 stop:1826 length:387 start_codon:yes stop_codon:yes gene_type:complete
LAPAGFVQVNVPEVVELPKVWMLMPPPPPPPAVAHTKSQSVALTLESTCPVVPPAGTSFEAGSTAAVPSPRFVRAVGALTRSERFDALTSFASSAVCRSVCSESVPVMVPQVVEVTGVTPPTFTVQAA